MIEPPLGDSTALPKAAAEPWPRSVVLGPENRLASQALQRCWPQSRATATSGSADLSGEADKSGEPVESDAPLKRAGELGANLEVQYSPLLLIGPSGVGKSHICHALIDAWRQVVEPAQVVTYTAADFVRATQDAQETQTLTLWRTRYRAARLFVLEDLADLVDRPGAQAELWHALDEFAQRGAQVVVTSRAPLHEMPGLAAGLVGRLEGGLMVPLVPPGPRSREALLGMFAQGRQITLCDEAREHLARTLTGSPLDIFGALLSLERDHGPQISAAQTTAYLRRRREQTMPSLRTIAQQTARHFSVTLADLRSASRRRSVVLARDVAMYLGRTLREESLNKIGKFFGGRDHATVAHGCRKLEQLLESDVALRRSVERVRQTLQQKGDR